MNINEVYYVFRDNGYLVMPTNLPYINFFAKKNEDAGIMNIIGCIDEKVIDKFNTDDLDNISFQIERKFLFSGMKDVNIIFIINSDNLEKHKVFCEGKAKVWIIDTICRRLIIFENQPEDFDALRNKIEVVISGNQSNKTQYNKKIQEKNIHG